MGDDLSKFGPMRIFVRPVGSEEPWHELKKATVRLSASIINMLIIEYRKPGRKRKELIRAMQIMGLLKKPKTTYKTNKEYFKGGRK